jgi:acetyl esterase/lipase
MCVRHAYGSEDSQYGDLYQACGPQTRGVVMLVHGGFWRTHRGLEMTAPAAAALSARGWHVFNVEYRRGGQWRRPLEDCLRAFEYLAEELQITGERTLLVGHSAGGHLAARTAGDQRVSHRVDGLVSLNGVVDLAMAHQLDIGESAVAEFLGPDATSADLELADAARHLPSAPTRCVHSRADERVPFVIAASYVETAQNAGLDCRLVEVTGNHTAVIEPDSTAWPVVLHTVEHWPEGPRSEVD